MKKLISLLIVLLLLSFTINAEAMQMIGYQGLVCTKWIEQTVGTGGGYLSSSGHRLSQKITNSAEKTICKVVITAYTVTTSSTFNVQLWSNEEKTATQYGSNSDSVVITADSPYNFVFGTQPVIPGDFFIHFVYVSDNDARWSFTTTNTSYSTTDYDLWYDGIDQNYDAVFEVWIMQ